MSGKGIYALREESCTLYPAPHLARLAPSPFGPNVRTLFDLFRQQAKLRSDAPLFSFYDGQTCPQVTLSYRETLNVVNNAARSLQERIDRPRVIGVWLERSIDLHLSILTATALGSAWLPFDADAPASRIKACLEDSQATAILCDTHHLERAREATAGCPTIVIDVADILNLASRNTESPGVRSLATPEDIAYMIYTSGSTGTPKGIAIPQKAALTFAMSEREVLQTSSSDVVWQGFSAAFDMFIEEVWISIAGGAHLIVASRQECQDVSALGGANGLWSQRGVTLVNAVPTLINIMTSLDDDCSLPSSIRLLNLGGEACPPALVNRLWHENLRIINTYGPSETTVTATFQELFPNEQVTIGKPLPSYHALIMPIIDDQHPGKIVPLTLAAGVEGELAIGGECLGDGYVGRKELTEQKFVPHPFGGLDSFGQRRRLYRTGDRVRLNEQLNIVFLGRIDTQVKHRGFRIELGEIESALSSHSAVQTCAVILSCASERLEAYYCAKDCTCIDINELRRCLSALPSYMHPEAYFSLLPSEMPRLPSGKINAKALQDISKRKANDAHKTDEATIEHASTLELDENSELGRLIAAMRKVFPQAAVLPTSDFFDDLGGHSLAAAMLVSRLRKQCPEHSTLRSVGLQDIYVLRTAEAIVAKYDLPSETSTFDEKAMFASEQQSGCPTGASTGDIWPISCTRFFFCGLAQIPALLFIFFLMSLQTFVPYLVFVGVHIATERQIGLAIAATYAAFVATPVFVTCIAVIAKWLLVGRVKAGEYPIYGWYYYRVWLSSRLIDLVDMAVFAETPIATRMWRLLGAKIGQHCHIGHVTASAFDLIEIGDDAVISTGSYLNAMSFERGRMILKHIKIGSGTYIGSDTVLEGGCTIEDDAEVLRLSMVPDGMIIPSGQRFHGSPAEYLDSAPSIGLERRTRPGQLRRALIGFTVTLLAVFVLPVLWIAPQIPTLILFEAVSLQGVSPDWGQVAIFAVPSAFAYLLLVFAEMIVIRWSLLGKVKECTYRTTSMLFVRRWFVDRVMALSLSILHPVYATLYVIPFLRALGVKMGKRAEVSTARGFNFELTEIGDESFVADNVHIGATEVRGNAIELRRTVFSKRAFAGNSSVIPQGTHLLSETLVGVLSVAPDPDHGKAMQFGQSCFGSPPVMMPARQAANVCHASHLLYEPRKSQIALRLFIEGSRIVLPRVLVIYGIGFGMSIFQIAYHQIGVTETALMLPFFHFFLFSLPALIVTLLSKWILIGRYKQAEWPLWSHGVWRSEFVTSTYETLAGPFLTKELVGTPFLAMCLRLFGVKIGARVTMFNNDITEYDMVTIGDEAIVNQNSGAQTHLFEDRVMKIGNVEMGKRACIKPLSILLPNSKVLDNAEVGSLSLVMKGETVPANEAWEGAPIAPRRRRRRAAFVQYESANTKESSKAFHGSPSTGFSSSPASTFKAAFDTPKRAGRANDSDFTLSEALTRLPTAYLGSRPSTRDHSPSSMSDRTVASLQRC